MKKSVSILLLVGLTISSFSQTKTGTLKIFSELTGISVYLDEAKQGDDIKVINGVPVGSHYLKVLLGTTSVYGDLVEIKDGETTTILIKNTGQVQEKIMDGKVSEREEYQNSKIDVLLSSNAVTNTTGKSSMFPGYYGYYGYNKSTSVTTNVSDFKIIQGSVKEISEMNLANLAGNQSVLQRNAADNAKIAKTTSVGAFVFLGSFVIGGTILADMLVKKPFLHKAGTTASNAEIAILTTCIVTGTISYAITMGADKHRPAHYYTPDAANKDAQSYNKKLKSKLGLPESYDVK
jgi:hypothetical protein